MVPPPRGASSGLVSPEEEQEDDDMVEMAKCRLGWVGWGLGRPGVVSGFS